MGGIQIHLKREERSYPIEIGELPSIEIEGKCGIVTNPKVGGLHLDYLLPKVKADELYIITLPDGEDYKNMESLTFLLDRLFDHRFDRRSTLIAFGGGVIGDMTGFGAAIYQRGIPFIQIPTTLLAQVDASVGGKTGINNRFGKNLIGAFHQPEAVYIDTYFLKTLPEREFAAGVAEIIKMAVIFDREFFNWLEGADLSREEDLRKAIGRSIELKAEIVALDEREGGVRASLNYGHTFAHVIENETGYRRYLHGEAVAMGMVLANRLALQLGLLKEEEARRIEELLKRYNLPTRYPIEDPEGFYDRFFLDKKSRGSQIAFVLPKGIGSFEIRRDIERERVLAVLRESAP
ncbi:MAG: 3-dehydroquinate synthase [Epsilonproteobacteria bacterium]|nr:3-dehydroquinate synthase [Campylobacterota bacterium]NPA56238.1 3-dehydroquinate synthase [Campylobacterota bacterium]